MTLYWQVPWSTQRSLDIDLLVSTRHKLGAMGLPFGSPQAHTNTYKHIVAPTGPRSHTCQNTICPACLPLIVAECANPIGSALPVYSSIRLRIMSDSSDKLLERSALIIDGRCSKSNGWDHNCIHHGNMWGTCEGDSIYVITTTNIQKMKFDHGWRGSTLPYFAKIPQ